MADTKLFLGNDSGIPIPGVGLLKTTEDDALFLDNIREIANLSMMRGWQPANQGKTWTAVADTSR